MAKRMIVKIDEELCNGCGKCVAPCAEGAIEIVNGKAKVLKEELCDGAGFCLGTCPTGALSLEEREAPAFDERLAHENMMKMKQQGGYQGPEICCDRCGATDEDRALLPVRRKGESVWVCTRCLPALIHG